MELGCCPHECHCIVLILDTRQLHDDEVVVATGLRGDIRFCDTNRIDSFAKNLDRGVQIVFGCEGKVLRCVDRFEHDLDPALQIQTKQRLLANSKRPHKQPNTDDYCAQ